MQPPDQAPQGQRPQSNHPLGLIGMICGIVGIPLAICFSLVGSVVGVVGIVLGVLGLNKVKQGEATNRGQALAGIITGAIALVIGIIGLTLGMIFFDDLWNNGVN